MKYFLVLGMQVSSELKAFQRGLLDVLCVQKFKKRCSILDSKQCGLGRGRNSILVE